MKLFNRWIVLLWFTVGAAVVEAREVDVLRFDSNNVLTPILPKTPDKLSTGMSILPSMHEHFASSPLDRGMGFFDTPSPNENEVSIKGPGAPFRLSGNSDMACNGAAYKPTWWLSQAAERRRAVQYATVVKIACDHRIPAHLLDAVIAQESGYNPMAISSAGAMGIMQIMPGTARSLGLATPFDTLSNLRAGASYLRHQLDRFGRVDLALAAYNAGPERRSLRRGYIPAIPETINYVRTITTNWARLAALGKGQLEAADRTFAALSAVRASGYRDVELIRYDGLN